MAWRGRATALKVTSIDQFKSYLAGLSLAGWRPAGMTLHNTASPSRSRWDAYPGETWMRNLKNYYEGLGWSAGPHAFVDGNQHLGNDGLQCARCALTELQRHTPRHRDGGRLRHRG